jgi:hypothetical protein
VLSGELAAGVGVVERQIVGPKGGDAEGEFGFKAVSESE